MLSLLLRVLNANKNTFISFFHPTFRRLVVDILRGTFIGTKIITVCSYNIDTETTLNLLTNNKRKFFKLFIILSRITAEVY